MTHLEMLILALIIDAVFGEPDWLWGRFPHPAALFGQMIAWADKTLNTGPRRKLKGGLALAAILLFVIIAATILSRISLFGLLETAGAAILLAHTSLKDHVRDVSIGLSQGLIEGRRAVALIVGRDADCLNESGVARSAIESAAENFSDGVVAPAFWFLLLGLPGIVFYKLVNTADSMIGYRCEKYADFGFAAARLDDLVNWIPARLTGGLICLVSWSRAAWGIMLKDARRHRSPNAGWPESAMAGVLDIALAGPRSYGGQMTEDPFLNDEGQRELSARDVSDSVTVLNRSWFGMLAILAGLEGLYLLIL